MQSLISAHRCGAMMYTLMTGRVARSIGVQWMRYVTLIDWRSGLDVGQ